jgi:hypothetical protein
MSLDTGSIIVQVITPEETIVQLSPNLHQVMVTPVDALITTAKVAEITISSSYAEVADYAIVAETALTSSGFIESSSYASFAEVSDTASFAVSSSYATIAGTAAAAL